MAFRSVVAIFLLLVLIAIFTSSVTARPNGNNNGQTNSLYTIFVCMYAIYNRKYNVKLST